MGKKKATFTTPIPKNQWNKKLSEANVRKADMNRLVMNFLVTECFVEAAVAFQNESGTEPADTDFTSITARTAVRRAVQGGQVQDAIKGVNDINPQILDTNPQLSFRLQQQRLIELIRAGETEEALEFSQEEMVPLCKDNELERTMVLLAFEDPSTCPVREVRELFDSVRREKIARELNAAILTSQGCEKGLAWFPQHMSLAESMRLWAE